MKIYVTDLYSQNMPDCQCPEGNLTGPNIIVNGNFDQGNFGFTSDYTIRSTCGPGMYNVSSSINLVNMCNDWGCVDHTRGDINGNVLVADGMQTAGPAVWRQDINLDINKTYKFCAFANNLNLPRLDRGDPIVEAYLISASGNSILLSSISIPEFPDEWINLSTDIITGAIVDNPFKLEFRTAGTTYEGNNFALDDIQLFECSKPSFNCNFLCNTDFEDRQLVASGKIGYFFEGTIPCWKTTSIDNLIEMWGDGYKGVPAYSGKQFIELNGNFVSTLFQEFTPSAGAEVDVSFAHRGRQGVDELSLEIGPVGGPYTNLGNFKADNTKWTYNTVSFQFPNNATGTYTIRFKSVSTAGGSTSGNFLDAISIKIKAPRIVTSIKNPSCANAFDGYIRIDSIFGAKPFQYKWSFDPTKKDSLSNLLASGMYSLTITDFYGCQHEYKFDLSNNQADSSFFKVQSCKDYNWPATGIQYNSSGRYQHTLKNQWQCDSILILDLKINIDDTVHIKEESCTSFFWAANNTSLDQSGTYIHSLANINTCDSVIILNLIIHKVDTSSIQETICDSFIWNVNNTKYSNSGRYYHSVQSSHSCDSILELDLKINSSYHINEKVTECKSFFWNVNNANYSQDGIYFYTLKSSQGCDSIHVLDLKINPMDTQRTNQKSCTEYFWPLTNQNYSQSGIYYTTLKNRFACDSVVQLQLEISESKLTSFNEEACESYTFPYNQQKYTQSGQYIFQHTSTEGCDSLVLLNLIIHPEFVSNSKVEACSEYTWPINGVKYNSSGNFTHKLQTISGCDSTYILNLTINLKDTQSIIQKSCNEYFWSLTNQSYTQSGTYSTILANQFACDSVVQLHLEISESKLTNINEESCVAYVFPFNQQRYTQSGQYIFKQSSSEGCDSVIILNLKIHPESMFKIQEKTCDEFFWPLTGETYLTSGTYTFNLKSQFGCDSTFQLDLKIDTGITQIDSITTFDTYLWPINSIQYDKDGIYELKFLNSSGCDSNFILVLKIIKEGEVFIPNIFSPNDDGINDFFTAYSTEEIAIIDRMLIYDRWGNLVYSKDKFESNNNSIGWNGTFKGQKLAPAVFAVFVEFTNLKGVRKTIKGDLTLLK